MARTMRNFIRFIKGILIGWLIGAGVGLVVAPRRGEETRAMLREKGMEVRDQAKSKVEETRVRAEEMAKKGREMVSEQKVVLESTVEGIREGVRTYQEESQADLPAPQEQAREDLMPGTTEENTL